jgi:hypothetical protein
MRTGGERRGQVGVDVEVCFGRARPSIMCVCLISMSVQTHHALKYKAQNSSGLVIYAFSNFEVA